MLEDFKTGKLLNSKLKEELIKVILDFLKPIQDKIKDYEKNPARVYKILEDGRQRAQVMAETNLKKIRKIVGLDK